MSPEAIAGHATSACQRIVDRRPLFRARRVQHEIDHLLLRMLGIARMADTDAQTPEVG